MDDILPPKRKPSALTTESSPDSDVMAKNKEKEPDFIPPEAAADLDIAKAAESAGEITDEPKLKIVKKKRRLNFDLHMPHGRKQWIITVITIIILLGGGFCAYWFGFHKAPKAGAPAPATIIKKIVPTTEVSNLSGLIVPIGTNKNPVTAVQIENSLDARPQAGLKEASIIFEAVAEGGITRFNAIFQDTAPDYVGPVRSLRPYYIDWFWPFDASIAHVGGSPKALNDIKSLGIKDIDQFANSGSYDRIKSRYAPHNVYTSIARLNELEKSKGFTSADYTPFKRKKDTKIELPTAKAINLNISSFYYNVHYDYDVATNTYLRSEGSAPHKDDKSGTQLQPKVVVAIVMSRGIDADGEHTSYTTVGTGNMFVFQDGIVTAGTWAKAGRKDQWTFTDVNGKAIAFNAGQTWITMVDATGSVTYTP